MERRAEASSVWTYASPLVAAAATAACAALLFWLVGKDVSRGLSLFFVEPLRGAYALSELGVKATPLILIALGLSVCFKASLWNIGAEGQYVLGAICAGAVAMRADDSTSRAIIGLILLCGCIGGMAWAAITAFLRERFQASEILVSLMLVYVAELLLSFLVSGPLKDPLGFNFPQTVVFAEPTQIPRLFTGMRLHAGALIACAAVLCVELFLARTRMGFALRVRGVAQDAARYAGLSEPRALWTSFLISGGLAGLAGALEAAGPLGQLTPHVPTGYGFSAIIVAFVGRLQPRGIVLAALLLSMFYIGGELAQSRLGLPKALTGVFQGLLLIALLVCDAASRYRLRWVPRCNPKKLAQRTEEGA